MEHLETFKILLSLMIYLFRFTFELLVLDIIPATEMGFKLKQIWTL